MLNTFNLSLARKKKLQGVPQNYFLPSKAQRNLILDSFQQPDVTLFTVFQTVPVRDGLSAKDHIFLFVRHLMDQ